MQAEALVLSKWHQVGLSLFNYQDYARSNKHKKHTILIHFVSVTLVPEANMGGNISNQISLNRPFQHNCQPSKVHTHASLSVLPTLT